MMRGVFLAAIMAYVTGIQLDDDAQMGALDALEIDDMVEVGD